MGSPHRRCERCLTGRNDILRVVDVLSPRFDTAALAATNTLVLLVWLAVLASLVLRQMSPLPSPRWAWAMVVLHVSLGGVAVPVGPIVVLALLRPRRPVEEEHSIGLPGEPLV